MIGRPESTSDGYLPARMLNEFTYCPRLFYYEHVQGLFVHNRETIEGALGHSRVDQRQDDWPPPEQLAEAGQTVRARSVMLASDRYRVIAKLDVLESDGAQVTPVDYKRGRPCVAADGSLEAWDADRIQLAVQALILIDQGYDCREAIVYYAATRQRVRIAIDDSLLRRTEEVIRQAEAVAASDRIPPPLVDSPKCPRCSLVGICLPDETNWLQDSSPVPSASRTQPAAGDNQADAPGPESCSPSAPHVQRTLFELDAPDARANAPSVSARATAPSASARRTQRTLFDREARGQATAAGSPTARPIPEPGADGSSTAGSEPVWRAPDGAGAMLAADVSRPSFREVRRLVPARDDLRPLYLNTPGLYVGKSGQVLEVRDKRATVQTVRLNEICQLNLMGNIQLTTQAIQALCQAEIPIAYFSMGGWFYGVTQGLGVKNIFLRREQFRLADTPSFCLRLARALIAGKIRNQRTMLQRNHVEPPASALIQMKCMQNDAERAETFDVLLGLEGNAARVYFSHFAGMLKVGGERDGSNPTDLPPEAGAASSPEGLSSASASPDAGASSVPSFTFDFAGRNRRPPRDPVNALLSLAYSVLAKDLTITAQTVGFDPYLGYFHQPRFGRASLALDLMEPFRPLIADSAVLSAINTRMVTPRDFIRASNAVALTAEGRKKFFHAYEQRMDTLVTHPLFGYRVNYRRLLEIQTRLLARVLTRELANYPVFTTR